MTSFVVTEPKTGRSAKRSTLRHGLGGSLVETAECSTFRWKRRRVHLMQTNNLPLPTSPVPVSWPVRKQTLRVSVSEL